MDTQVQINCTAFEGYRRIASGKLAGVALEAKKVIDRGERAPVLIFDDMTSEQLELDLRGTSDDVLTRLAAQAREAPESDGAQEPTASSEGQRGPGRPRLGVVAREVTLLPRHWHWLNGQPGGASVALRKLVEQARRANEGRDKARRAQEAAYRFMSTMAGNLPSFEEAARALFARDPKRLGELTRAWPKDVRKHLERLVNESVRLDAEANPSAAASTSQG